MEINRSRTLRMVTFVATVVWLIAMVAGLGVLMFFMIHGAEAADGGRKAYMVRLAWLVLVLMCMTLVVLTLVVAHFVRRRLVPPRERPPTAHVDAWAEAGRRYKLPQDQDDQDDQDEPDETP